MLSSGGGLLVAHRKKLKTFICTSDLPYDRHKYKCVLKDGREVILDDYELVRAVWNQYGCDKVEVL